MNDSRPPKPDASEADDRHRRLRRRLFGRRDGKHRRFQFSLRTLLLFVLVSSVGFSWLGIRLQRARKNRQADTAVHRQLAEAKRRGGYVFVEHEHRLEWLEKLLGDPGDVIDVRFVAKRRFGDADVKYLDGAVDLEKLCLQNTKLTDAGLEHVKELTSLSILELGGTQVTDDGLVHLKGLTKLEFLSLGGTRVTDGGLKHLKGLTSLKELYVVNSQVTDAGVKQLQETLPNCKIDH